MVVSILAISLVVASPKLRESLASAVVGFDKALFWTCACLTGQFGGTNEILRSFTCCKPFVIITVFYFFMMGSEFYQGSLFSSLISTTPPQLPNSKEGVLNSNMEIITTGTTSGGSKVKFEHSSVVDFMIPEFLRKTENGTNLHQILTKLKSRALYVPALNKFEFGIEIADSLEFKVNGVKKKLGETFAIVDNEKHVANFLDGLRSKRTLWSRRFDELGLFHVAPIMMHRTWLFPILSEGLGRLCQSGLYHRWESFDRVSEISDYDKKLLGKRWLFRKITYKLLFQVERMEFVFEESNPVSLIALRNMVKLYGVLILIGICLFVLEGSISLRHKLHNQAIRVVEVFHKFVNFVWQYEYIVWVKCGKCRM